MAMFFNVFNSTKAIQVNWEFGHLGLVFNHGQVCMLELNRFRYLQLRDHKLETVFRYVRDSSAAMRKHRALDDTRIVAAVRLVIEKR